MNYAPKRITTVISTEGSMKTNESNHNESDVLFQKLGNTWYVFSEIKDELVYSALPAGLDPRRTDLELYDVIEDHLKKVANISRGPEAAA